VDIVIGSRYIPGGKDQERSVLRKIISLFARICVKILTGINLKDVTSGYRIFRRKVLETIIPYLSSSDPFIVTEVNYISKNFDFKFTEIPITFHKRLYGHSKLSISKLLAYPFKIVRLVIKWFLLDKYNVLFTKTLLFTSLIRFVIAGLFGLTDDEAHYWQYAQHPEFSYYDHPPMVGYIIYLSTKILGNNIYGVRLPAIFCFSLAVIYFYRLVKELFNTKVAYWSSLLFQVIPIGFAGSIVTIPDAPLSMFWMIYMFYFYKFLITEDTLVLYLAGLILGLAALSKYTALLLFVSSIIIMFSDYKLRKYFLRKDFYVFCLISFAISSPVFLWNIAHDFASFKYQLFRGFNGQKYPSISLFISNLSYQAAYISPVVFLLVWYSIFRFLKNINEMRYRYLLYFSLPGLILFNIFAFKTTVLPHWPAISYFVLLPLLVCLNTNKIAYFLSLISAGVMTLAVTIVTLFGLIKIPEHLVDADTPDKLYGWEVAAKETKRLMKQYSASFLITSKYYTAGQLRFALAKYCKDDIPKIYCLDEEINQYDFWYKDLDKYNGKDAIFIIEGRHKDAKKVLNVLPFEGVKPVSVVTFRKSKWWPKRIFEFYICEKFNYSTSHRLIQQKYNNFLYTTQFYRNYDKKIFLKINQARIYNSKLFRTVALIVTNLGSGLVLVPIMIFILLLIDRRNSFRNIISYIFIIIIGGLLVQILKNIFDKPRPLKLFSDILQQPINVIGEQLRELGFPSGHTFLAVSSAMFLSERMKKLWLTFVLFILAILVGISRVVVGAHFLSDVIGGFLIGIIFTKLWLKLEEELK
ncbi:MAG: glycosyltransferase family 39 protein, partial [Endomicrobia bacterium]|nr:glycosyltransferase family 39 protein [Endomicrobiia bacterium]